MGALAVVLALLLLAAVAIAWREHRRALVCAGRAEHAAAREREADALAAIGRRLLRGGPPAAQLEWIGTSVAEALGAEEARVSLASVPVRAADGERVVRLPLQDRTAWLYVRGGDPPDRMAEALARLIDVALERGRVGAREAEADAARRGNIAKTAVLHMVSNDLRPLVHAVETEVGDDAPERLRNASAVLARLVDDLVDLSRLEAGTLRTRPEAVDLHQVVGRVVAPYGDAVAVRLPSGLSPVLADPDQVERVLAGLVGNAVRFSPDGVPVRVSGGESGGRATVRVIDRGPGIPHNQRARVFDPFFQGRPSDEGAGLGLALARGFVEANGGRIVLQSGTDGETAFAVTLPVASA